MDTIEREALLEQGLAETRTTWITLGIVELLVGIAALVLPLVAALATTLLVAVALAVGGVARLVHAFQVRRWSGFFGSLLLAILYLVAAGLIVARPWIGVLSLGLVVGAWCFVMGVVTIGVSLRRPRLPAWGWLLASGIAGTLLGLMILLGWPAAGVLALGVIVGVNFVFSGVSALMVGSTVATLEERHAPA